MATEADYNVTTPEMEEAMEEDAEDKMDDQLDNQFDLTEEEQQAYGYPTPDEKYNQWVILSKALEKDDTVRTTYLSTEELGRPLFSVRFWLDMWGIAGFYNAPKVATYISTKVQNVTSSGMSNKGFAMNLSVTQKREATRKKIRDYSKINQKGGK